MREFNPATIPTTGLADTSQNASEEQVLEYIRSFNQLVLNTSGGRPDIISEGVVGGFRPRSAIQLSEEQRQQAERFFGSLEGQRLEQGAAARSPQEIGLRSFVQTARNIRGTSLSDSDRNQIDLFLELIEAAVVNEGSNVPGGEGFFEDQFGFERYGNELVPIGGSTLGRSGIDRVLDSYYDQQDEAITSRTLNNEEAFTAIIQRQQGLLSILTPSILQSGLVNLFYKDIYQIEALDASSFLSLFTNKPNYQNWFQAPSIILSCITPKIKIYKQYNTSDGEKLNVEFKFPNKMSEDNISDIVSGTGRGGGYGIKSFSWSYEGQNPFEISRNIKAKLELYIQDLKKLFPPNATISNTQVRFERDQQGIQEGYLFELFRNISFSDGNNTIADSENSPEGSFIDPYDYRLKIDVGWNFDRSTLDNLGLDRYIQFFEEAVKTLDLGLITHDIVFNQDGSIGISLTYQSFLDSVMRNSDFYNILSAGDQRLFRRIEKIRQRSQSTEGDDSNNGSGQCNTNGETVLGDASNGGPREINTNSELFQNLLQSDFNSPDNIIANYSSIFNRLIEESRIYVLGFDYGLIADEVSTEQVGNIVDNALDEGETEQGERESYLRIVQNELSLEAIENSSFNIGRLSEDGVALLTSALEAQQEVLAERIADQDDEQAENISLTFNLDGQTPLSVLNSGNVSSNPYTVGAEATGKYVRTYFTTLGDIIQSVLGSLIEAQGPQAREDAPYLISGPYLFKDIRNRNILINLSNILVDIDSFRKFFTEKVISNLRTSYTLEQFIKDMYSSFSYETNARAVAQGTNLISSNSRLFYNVFSKSSRETKNELLLRLLNFYYGSTNITVPVITEALSFIYDSTNIIQLPQSSEFVNRTATQIIDSLKPKILNVESFFKETTENLNSRPSSGDFAPELSDVPRTYNYIYITAAPTNLVYDELGTGEYEYPKHREFDNGRGIYHLTFGEKNSIIKNLSFEKFDDPSLRTSRLIGGGADSLNYLRELYNVNLSLIGTPFLIPGQYLYLNPIFMGAGTDARDISEFLGFGGYYYVLNVSNKIDSNHNYTTECKLFFQSSGRPTDESACFLRNPISLYSEEAVELADIRVEERTAVEEAEQELQDAIADVGDGPADTSGNEYTFENYSLSVDNETGRRTRIKIGSGNDEYLINSFNNDFYSQVVNLTFKLNIDINNSNDSTINIISANVIGSTVGAAGAVQRTYDTVNVNDVSININRFITLNENSENERVLALVRELQAILDAQNALLGARNQQNQNDQ